MNNFLKFMPVAAVAAMGIVVSSCGDDNDEPAPVPTPPTPPTVETPAVNPASVFTNGLPTEVGDMVITSNAEGLVTKIVIDNEEVMTFDYTGSATSKARGVINIPATYDAVIKYDEDNDGKDEYIYYVTLTPKGFIQYAYQVEVGNDNDGSDTAEEWWFKYDDNDRMIEMKRTEGNNEVTTIGYDTAGNIVNVKMKDDDGDSHETVITYGSQVNKSGIMLYDNTFRIDMDEMAPAYFAGMLGKGTANLPIKAVEDNTYTYTFTWTLDSNSMPTLWESEMTGPYGTEQDSMTFKWK